MLEVRHPNSPPHCLAFCAQPSAQVTSHRFDVSAEAPSRRLEAWQNRPGNVLDLSRPSSPLEQPFFASITRHTVGDLRFSDIYSDPVQAERSIARISSDPNRNHFFFSVCVEGDSHTMQGRYATRSEPVRSKILALDTDQPISMRAHRHRMSTYLVPRALMESIMPDADALHGRSLDDTTPIARLLIAHSASLNQAIGAMHAQEADAA